MEFLANRKEIEDELRLLVAQEQKIEEDLEKYFSVIAGGKKSVSNNYNSNSNNNSNNSNNNSNNLIVYESSDLGNSLEKMNKFNLYQESMIKDSKTLSTQIEDCRALSERLSKIVRRLDTMQIHAQEALACTEDIINLKDCKNRITNAIEQNNLPVAVSNIRQVHEIDLKAAMTSDDFDIIVQKEQEVKELVRKEFGEAISASNINKVMSLCPLLQTLGLEDQARDTFLDFIEKQVFIAVSADASSVDGATDPATGYAQALSNVFNSTYLIIQQYLPMVIQGMENSLGDVYFIQRLHGKCEKESGLVLKRYMKYRNLKDLIASLRQGKGPQGKPIIAADMHAVMDEVALLIQYCCRYSKYLKHVCKGAESKPRHKVRDITLATAKEKLLANGSMKPTTPSASVPETTNAIVFKGPTEFDKMIDELINKYYMEGEQWLMKGGIRNALPKSVEDGHKIDECFFVLQKCGLRALATNNIHAACAVLHLISDLLSSDLLSQATEMLNNSIAKLSAIISEHMNRFKPTDSTTSAEKSASLSKGFQSAISLATTITGSYASDGSDSVLQEAVRSGGSTGKTEDPWGVLDIMEAFNIVELCARYTDRLNKDILSAGQRVFDGEDLDGASGKADSLIPKSALVPSTSSEMDKLKLCKEDFDNVKLTYSSVSI